MTFSYKIPLTIEEARRVVANISIFDVDNVVNNASSYPKFIVDAVKERLRGDLKDFLNDFVDDEQRRETERRAIEWRQTVEEHGPPIGAVSQADGFSDAVLATFPSSCAGKEITLVGDGDGISVECPNCGACLDTTSPSVNAWHLNAGCRHRVAAVAKRDDDGLGRVPFSDNAATRRITETRYVPVAKPEEISVPVNVAGTQAYRGDKGVVIICGNCGHANDNADTPEVYHHLNGRCTA